MAGKGIHSIVKERNGEDFRKRTGDCSAEERDGREGAGKATGNGTEEGKGECV